MMGQHKYNPVAIAAINGELQKNKSEMDDEELYRLLPPEMRTKYAKLTATMAAMSLFDYESTNPRR